MPHIDEDLRRIHIIILLRIVYIGIDGGKDKTEMSTYISEKGIDFASVVQ